MQTTFPFGLIAQIIMLVLWYTVLPGLPAWVVFLPLICVGVGLAVTALIFAVGVVVMVVTRGR